MSASDKTLVRQLLAGNEEAFALFFTTNFDRLYRFALTRTDGDADAAEEAVQKTLIAGLRKIHTFRGEAALFTWLCTICRHEISAWRLAKGRQAELILSEDAPEVRDQLAAIAMAAMQPDEAFARNETARLVQVALDLLPGAYSDLLEWKYIHGLTVAEISERSQRGPKAVESMLVRARKAFRDVFAVLEHHEQISAS